uniref:Uncharacterized protein n=1 Tax=Arundo donax TaxID=35708 RepID=A0A0A9DGL4_ARUDO
MMQRLLLCLLLMQNLLVWFVLMQRFLRGIRVC